MRKLKITQYIEKLQNILLTKFQLVVDFKENELPVQPFEYFQFLIKKEVLIVY
jgi:hypothetical protein